MPQHGRAARALADWPALALFLLSFSFLYTVVPLAFWGHTLGMAWAGLTARNRDGEPLTFDQTARRWLGGLLTLAILGLPLLVTGDRRSLTDLLSGSATYSGRGAGLSLAPARQTPSPTHRLPSAVATAKTASGEPSGQSAASAAELVEEAAGAERLEGEARPACRRSGRGAAARGPGRAQARSCQTSRAESARATSDRLPWRRSTQAASGVLPAGLPAGAADGRRSRPRRRAGSRPTR